MNPKKIIFIIPIFLLISGCSKSEIGQFKPDTPTNSSANLPDTQIENSAVNYTNNTNWSKFSFSNFSFFLPKDFQVGTMNNDQTQITLSNFPYNPGQVYDKSKDTNHFLINISISKPAKTLDNPNLNIKSLSANKTTQDTKTTVTISNADQDTTYILYFDFDFNQNQELLDKIIETLNFHQRGKL